MCGNTWRWKMSNLPNLYLAHKRNCIIRDGVILAASEYLPLKPEEQPEEMTIRFRTIGDMTCTGAVESNADTLEKVIVEIETTRQAERGARADDKRSETSMEDRKKQGYF